MAREPVAGMMDRNVPAQLDEEDLRAELEIELPDSQNVVEANIVGENVGEIEISETEDGGVTVDLSHRTKRAWTTGFMPTWQKTCLIVNGSG